MTWLKTIPIIGDLVTGTTDIIKEVVVDKDKQNEIIGNLQQIKEQVYIQELQTKTIPWVDAVHKMGRQILNALSIIAVTTLIVMEIEITQYHVLLLGGPNLAYQLIKGRGRR